MCLCGAVVILHFTQMDPLNPKPITGDLSSVLLQASLPIGGCNNTLRGLLVCHWPVFWWAAQALQFQQAAVRSVSLVAILVCAVWESAEGPVTTGSAAYFKSSLFKQKCGSFQGPFLFKQFFWEIFSKLYKDWAKVKPRWALLERLYFNFVFCVRCF